MGKEVLGGVITKPAAEYVFTESQASLGDGAEIDSGWMDTETWDKYQLEVDSDQILTLTISSATGAGGTGIVSVLPTIPPQAVYSISVPPRRRYVRYQLQNLTGGPVTNCAMSIKATYGSSDKQTVIPLSFAPADVSQAALVAAVGKGRRPDGAYINTPADGILMEYTTPILAAGSVTLGPFDTEGFKSIEMYIATDQVSDTNGIVVAYTSNPNAVTPTYYPGQTFTFGPDAVSSGFVAKRFAPVLSGFKITFTNGGFAQGSLYFALRVKNSQAEPTSVSVENDINATQGTVLSRAVIAAKNDIGTYGNIMRGARGGHRVSIYEHEAETPIKPLNALSGNATSVGSGTATRIASAAPAGTKSIEIQADPDNTKIVYLGFNSGVNSGNAPLALNAGDARVYEVDGTPQFWAIAASGSQAVRWTYIGES